MAATPSASRSPSRACGRSSNNNRRTLRLTLAQAESSSKSDASAWKREKETTTANTFNAGDDCVAPYSGDNKLYPTQIASVGGSSEKPVYSVVFKGYNTTKFLPSASVQPLPTNYNLATHSVKRELSREEAEERERKKIEKKLESAPPNPRSRRKNQQFWQKVARKSEKKGIHLAGVSGTSIFKTPDNPLGRVVVTNSGKAMRPYGDRVKHKSAADEAT